MPCQDGFCEPITTGPGDIFSSDGKLPFGPVDRSGIPVRFHAGLHLERAPTHTFELFKNRFWIHETSFRPPLSVRK